MKKNAEMSMACDKKAKTGIMIVDDHPYVRLGIANLINTESDMSVCCEAGDYDHALMMLERAKPDIVIVDLSLKDKSGLELTEKINSRYPELPVIILSMHDESLYAERAISSGARGYVMKNEDPEVLVNAIRTVLSGKIFVSRDIASNMLERKYSPGADPGKNQYSCLSNRELEIFQCLGKGLKPAHIAEMLHLSVKTVYSHIEGIKKKLSLKDKRSLLIQASVWCNKIND